MHRTRTLWRLAAALAFMLSIATTTTTTSAAPAAAPPAQKSRAEAQAFIDESTAKYNDALKSSYKPGQAVVPASGPVWTADLDTWVEYTFPASSGASCLNGTPYRMYYKIASEASMRDKVLVDFEGGGACWDFESCKPGAKLGASNPDGLPSGYIQGDGILTKTATALTSPVLDGNTFLADAAAYFIFGRGSGTLDGRSWWNFLKLTSQPQTQRWTKLVFPYCTGDVNAGASFRVLEDPSNPQNSKKVNFNGLNNVRAAMEFLRKNKFAESLSGKKSIQQLLVYGVSAGGYSSLANYPMIREALAGEKTRAAMFSDASPILPGAVYQPDEEILASDLDKTPAVKFWQKVTHAWGWFQKPTAADANTPGHPEYAGQAEGLIARWEKATGEKVELLKSRGGDTGNLNKVLSKRYAEDRFGLSSFQQDLVIPGFAFGGGQNAEVAGLTGSALRDANLKLFTKEMNLVRANLGPLPNYGYYMPWSRYLVLGSHGVTPLTFAGTDISRAGNLRDDGGRIAPGFNGDVGFFLNNLISAQSPQSLPVLKEVGAPGESFSGGSLLGTVLSWFHAFG
ncbi:hypothetical protein J2W34_002073 [Variovorax boronicumulans]|uniref:hypothetical protein n=1 Tax=Variovorax boronicumulans TaxID=436515 RepID=UPI002785F545|nr:hypothetical protein [Variovorax boronicumulans]MDQ0070288.1 hypothetical protein [Variovorax boronicumulans]